MLKIEIIIFFNSMRVANMGAINTPFIIHSQKPYGDNITFYNLWRGRRQQKISTDKQAKRFHSTIVCKQLSKWLPAADERQRLLTQTTGEYRRHRVQRTCSFKTRKIFLQNYAIAFVSTLGWPKLLRFGLDHIVSI